MMDQQMETQQKTNPEPTAPPGSSETLADPVFDASVERVKVLENTYQEKLGELQLNHAAAMDDLAEKHATGISKVRLGHEAMMLQDAAVVMRENRSNEGHKEILKGAPVDPTTEDVNKKPAPGIFADLADMINLGEINIEQPREPNPPTIVTPHTTVQQPVTGQPPKASGLGKLAKIGIAAALIGSGVGAAVGIPMAINAIFSDKKPDTVTSTMEDTDTDTFYELRLHPPDENSTE